MNKACLCIISSLRLSAPVTPVTTVIATSPVIGGWFPAPARESSRVLELAVWRNDLMKKIPAFLVTLAFCANLGWAQNKLSVHWEELTAAEFRSGIQQSQGV